MNCAQAVIRGADDEAIRIGPHLGAEEAPVLLAAPVDGLAPLVARSKRR